MAEVRINPEQLQEAVNASLKRALVRDPGTITRPILIGIIAYPNDNRLQFEDIQVSVGEIQAQAKR